MFTIVGFNQAIIYSNFIIITFRDFISQFYEAFTQVYSLFCNYRSIFASTFDYLKTKYEGQPSKTKHKLIEKNIDEYSRILATVFLTFFSVITKVNKIFKIRIVDNWGLSRIEYSLFSFC